MSNQLQDPLQQLEQKFQSLDQLPETLYDIIVTHPHGELNQRIKGILQWRKALLQGHLPNHKSLVWPEASIREMVLKRLDVLEIVQYCKNQETLTDSILEDVCEAISTAEQWQKIDPGFDDKLARRHKHNDRDSAFKDDGLSDHPEDPSEQNTQPQPKDSSSEESASDTHNIPSESPQQDLSESTDSVYSPDGSEEGVNLETANSPFILDNDSILEKSWQELAQQWHKLEPVFSELSEMLGRGWDLTQGLLASQQWRDIIRYRKLVKQLPWLEQVVAALGRLQEKNTEQEQSTIEQVFEPVKRMVEQEIKIKTPYAVAETSGIRRSDDISRLLPCELMQLGHPQLNCLWHAKRAEHTLLTYQVEGVLSEHEPLEMETFEEVEHRQNETESGLGPILVCLDGSASMQGEAENIAKALVLEALRIAWQENRACYVYLFSGLDQILQHELDLTQGGLSQLLEFLTQTFHGGTDVIKPLLTALKKTQQQGWEKADVLLVTDGRFPVTEEHKKRLQDFRSKDIRLHGILIGQWQGRAMQEICHYFHRV